MALGVYSVVRWVSNSKGETQEIYPGNKLPYISLLGPTLTLDYARQLRESATNQKQDF